MFASTRLRFRRSSVFVTVSLLPHTLLAIFRGFTLAVAAPAATAAGPRESLTPRNAGDKLRAMISVPQEGA